MPTVKDQMLHPTKGVQHTKKQAFRQHVVDSHKSYASIPRQNSALPQPQDKAFTFSAEQLIKFVANVAIQVTQPQVCYANTNQDAINKIFVSQSFWSCQKSFRCWYHWNQPFWCYMLATPVCTPCLQTQDLSYQWWNLIRIHIIHQNYLTISHN